MRRWRECTSAHRGRTIGDAVGLIMPRRSKSRVYTPRPILPQRRFASEPSDTVASGTGKRQQFRILFMAERVVRATDMRDALRQAESLGATEITAVSRED